MRLSKALGRGAFSYSVILLAAAAATKPALADQLQNSTVGATVTNLLPFGGLDGSGVTVGVIEAGAALANTSTPGVTNSAPGSNLVNGNPDLPYSHVKLFQLPATGGANPSPAGAIPNGGALPAGLSIGDHATEVTGVIAGQGNVGPADRGIAPGSIVQQAGINGGDQDATNGVPALIQKAVATLNASVVNLSFGASQYQITGNPTQNQTQFLTFTINPGNGKITSYGTQLITFGAAIPALPANTFYALDSNNNGVTVYSTNAGALIPTNNGSAYDSKFVDWESVQNKNALIVVAGNESDAPAPRAVPGIANNGVELSAALPAVGTVAPANFGNRNSFNTVGAPSDAYNILNVGATGAYVAGKFTYDQLSDYNTTNNTSDRRVGVNLVAPGGDPAGNTGTAGTDLGHGLVFANNFKSTAGGTVNNGSDTYNGVEPGFVDPTTASNYVVNGANIQPQGVAGTSFAAPLVSGAAAVLVQYAANGNLLTAGSDPFDHRVLKAILMNGAQKFNQDSTPLLNAAGATWQAQAPIVSPFTAPAPFAALPSYKNGVATGLPAGQFPVQSGLDPTLGTGQLDLLQSLINYAAGEQGPGIVSPIGWDYHVVPNGASGQPNQTIYKYDFLIGAAGSGFQATLDWDAPVSLTGGTSGNTLWAPNATLTRGSLQDLDLYLFSTNGIGGALTQNLDFSTSLLDNDQHIYVPSIDPGTYELDVVVQGTATQDTPYGLAWSTVPEPTTVCLLLIPAAMFLRRRRVAA